MPTMNRQWKLARRPTGMVRRDDFALSESPVPEPADGQLVVRTLYISLDPAMRGWLNDVKSYIPPVQIGEVMRAGALGKVIVSKNPKFKAGDVVTGMFGIQDYALTDGKNVHKIDPRMGALPVFLSTLGMPGMTAYFGLLEIGQPKPGETVVVSGAAGAVGQVVGQIAKLKGCRAIGIAGGKDKCQHVVKELGFDACIDYKSEDVKAALKQHCPKGIDVYFDNVGGEILDAVLTRLAMRARIVICGAISQYNNTTPVKGPSNYMSLLVFRARMQGFVVFDYADRYEQAIGEMARWLLDGKMRTFEDVCEGLETFPETLSKLFTGENTGKLVLKVADA